MVDAIVAAVEEKLSVQAGSMQARVVSDRIQQIRDDKEALESVLTAVGFGLALLAIPFTAGASLGVAGAFIAAGAAIGSLGITAWIAIEHAAEFRLQQAMTGTHFDKAMALAQEDPSLGWLAFDIVGAAIDIVDVFKAFRAIAPAVRRAIALKRMAKAPAELNAARKALEELEAVANAQGRGLGPVVREKAEAIADDHADRLAAAADNWRAGLDATTKTKLTTDKTLRQTFEQMDPEVRAVLTRCVK
jgi:hypothetical protein